MRHLTACFLLVLAASSSAVAQTPLDLVDKVIIALFRDQSAKLLCLNEDSSLPTIKSSVQARLQQMAADSTQSQDVIARAVYTQFPCPFSPYRKELRVANATDIQGVWLFPERSQRLRFGPSSPNWTADRLPPIRCEGVAYYSDGEARNVQILGTLPCTFSMAKDMDVARKNPRVANWTISNEGRLGITRTDVPGHVEEWEVFVVTSAFDVKGFQFRVGDIIQYLRRERGNEFNAATMFRHLQRLP
jgi:hypothetical protein